jgi:hypothetical protein
MATVNLNKPPVNPNLRGADVEARSVSAGSLATRNNQIYGQASSDLNAWVEQDFGADSAQRSPIRDQVLKGLRDIRERGDPIEGSSVQVAGEGELPPPSAHFKVVHGSFYETKNSPASNVSHSLTAPSGDAPPSPSELLAIRDGGSLNLPSQVAAAGANFAEQADVHPKKSSIEKQLDQIHRMQDHSKNRDGFGIRLKGACAGVIKNIEKLPDDRDKLQLLHELALVLIPKNGFEVSDSGIFPAIARAGTPAEQDEVTNEIRSAIMLHNLSVKGLV